MEQRRNPTGSLGSATKHARDTETPANTLMLAAQVRNYRCFLRLLPRRVYTAIMTAVWER
jgi:hypothetical protein